MTLPSGSSAAKLVGWEKCGKVPHYHVSCIPPSLFSPPHYRIFILKDHEKFSSLLPFFHSIFKIFCATKGMKLFLSKCFKRTSEIFISEGIHLSQVFFLCKLEQALEVSFVKYVILSTQQRASAPGTQVTPLLQWQVFEEAILQVCKCRGIKRLAASKHPTVFQRNIGNTSSLQHYCTSSHVTLNVYCTHFYIFLPIQSHTLILLFIALSVCGVVLPQTSWIPFLISSLSPDFEHPKLEI